MATTYTVYIDNLQADEIQRGAAYIAECLVDEQFEGEFYGTPSDVRIEGTTAIATFIGAHPQMAAKLDGRHYSGLPR